MIKTESTDSISNDDNINNNNDDELVLHHVFESYARLYPNPRLAEERHQRDELVRALAAATTAASSASHPPTATDAPAAAAAAAPVSSLSTAGGWMRRWLFESKSDNASTKNKATNNKDNNNDDDDEYESQLVYTTGGKDNNDDDDAFASASLLLCGTLEASLDVTCIPPEAHCVARFHLASSLSSSSSLLSSFSSQPARNHTTTRRRRSHNNNHHHHRIPYRVARSAWEIAGTSCIMITGLGHVVEVTRQGTLAQTGPVPVVTSDRHDLWRWADHFSLTRVRAAHLGPNCIFISWGLPDGVMVVYRRLARRDESSKKMATTNQPKQGSRTKEGDAPEDNVVWQAVAWIGPSPEVQAALLEDDVFMMDDHPTTSGMASSPSLTVTDVVPLVVDTDSVPAVSLAIARLAGTLELVPLPPQYWYGPELASPPPPPARNNNNNKKSTKKSKPKHYTDHLVNLVEVLPPGSIIPVTTREYHTDIMCLEAIRTRVSSSNHDWDAQAYPEGPPADFIVAAAGTLHPHGTQAMSFWSVRTMFLPEADPKQQPSRLVDFQLHMSMAEAIEVGRLGPDVSFFCGPEILKWWRKPRNVHLKDNATMTTTTMSPANSMSEPEGGEANSTDLAITAADQNNSSADPLKRVTTISLSAPIVSMRFIVTDTTLTAAVLDWNGGVSLLDCGLLERSVSQRLSPDEYELLNDTSTSNQSNNEEESPVVPLVKMLADRSRIARLFYLQKNQSSAKPYVSPALIVDIQWLKPKSDGDVVTRLACLTTGQENSLHVVSVNQAGVLLNEPLYTVSLTPAASKKVEPPAASSFVLVSNLYKQLAVLSIYRTKNDESNSETMCFGLSVLNEVSHPLYIIQALSKHEKFDEAIQAAKFFRVENFEGISEIVESSKKQQWKSTHDMECLMAVTDVAFVVEEALGLSEASNDGASDAENLALFRNVHRLALERIARPTTTDQHDDLTKSRACQLQERLIRLGTYELLCRHLEVEASYVKFCTHLLPQSMSELAIAFVQSNDFRAASIICFRHRHETMQSCDVVDAVPIITRLKLFHHLLPLLAAPNNSGNVTHFIGMEQNLVAAPWRSMPIYLNATAGTKVLIDEFDEYLVFSFRPISIIPPLEPSQLEHWYAERVKKILKLSYSLDQTIELCRVAFVALRMPFDDLDVSMLSSDLGFLYTTLHRAEAVERAILDQPESPLSTLNLSKVQTMALVDLVSLIFHDVVEEADFCNRARDLFFPLIGQSSSTEARKASLDAAIFSHCYQMLLDASTAASCGIPKLLRSIKACSYFAKLSSSSQNIKNRMVKSKDKVQTLLGSAFCFAVEAFEKASSMEQRALVEALWSIYETLPARIPHETKSTDENDFSHDLADCLFDKLVILDVLSQWPNCSALALSAESPEDSAYEAILMSICNSFCHQIEQKQHVSKEDERRLLTILLSDFREVCRLRCMAGLASKSIFMACMFAPLLRQKHVFLLDDLLSLAEEAWIDRELAIKSILAFIKDAFFAGESSNETQRAALGLQNIIKRHFPESAMELSELQRPLEAAHFINTVSTNGIEGATVAVKPAELLDQYPFDVIESLLCRDPWVILCDCKEWRDPVWASEANLSFRVSQSNRAHLEPSLPPLPGRAIFHLAKLLGLDSDAALIAVKCLVVRDAVRLNLYGAAAAICRTLFTDHEPAVLNQHAAPVLQALVAVILHPDYHDVAVKEELSARSLSKFSCVLDAQCAQLYEAIATWMMSMEYSTLRTCTMIEGRQRGQDFKALRSVEGFYLDTSVEYATDIFDLFSVLQSNFVECVVDDSLLNALARFAGFWCIAQGTRPKSQPIASAATASAFAIFQTACSLLFHNGNIEMFKSSISELQKILESQQKIALESNPPFVAPDFTVVRRLMGRGYSEHGSKRAVAMTGNAGYDAALQWAVAHSLDPDFDLPLVALRTKDAFFDDELARLMEHFLLNAEDGHLTRDKLISMLCPHLVIPPKRKADFHDALALSMEEVNSIANISEISSETTNNREFTANGTGEEKHLLKKFGESEDSAIEIVENACAGHSANQISEAATSLTNGAEELQAGNSPTLNGIPCGKAVASTTNGAATMLSQDFRRGSTNRSNETTAIVTKVKTVEAANAFKAVVVNEEENSFHGSGEDDIESKDKVPLVSLEASSPSKADALSESKVAVPGMDNISVPVVSSSETMVTSRSDVSSSTNKSSEKIVSEVPTFRSASKLDVARIVPKSSLNIDSSSPPQASQSQHNTTRILLHDAKSAEDSRQTIHTPASSQKPQSKLIVSISPITGLPMAKSSTPLSATSPPTASPQMMAGHSAASLRAPTKPSFSLNKTKPSVSAKLGVKLNVDVATRKSPLQVLSVSTSPINSLSRSALLKRGQTAFRSARTGGSSASNSPTDRKRLIEEGRRLLRLARESGVSPTGSAMSSSTPSPSVKSLQKTATTTAAAAHPSRSASGSSIGAVHESGGQAGIPKSEDISLDIHVADDDVVDGDAWGFDDDI